MSITLTVRTDKTLHDALRRRAKERGTTVSDLVRGILESELVERPLREKVGHLRGGLELAVESRDAWQREIRERNWRS